ncbi:hypothetical protein D3869_01230 [Azospirillum brasilense]|uniref:DNA 3'-5' helicase II n=1 Tax=Azospirillum brasilense TaxID=192 RepID=A0A4D8QUX3_AZOBR|nr:UvrD-helicase domain-containing protein [Azospirillum brasilense]QCO13967.1 hypothetical protein D3869_01230 [Azospirillum brasilense]
MITWNVELSALKMFTTYTRLLDLLRSGALPEDGLTLFRVGQMLYALGPDATEQSQLAVIRMTGGGIVDSLPEERHSEALSRALTASLSVFEASVKIPEGWHKFNHGSIVTFQSDAKNVGENVRLLLDRRPDGSNHSYIFGVDTENKDWSELIPDFDLFRRAIASYPKALLFHRRRRRENGGLRNVFDLGDNMPNSIAGGWSYDSWLDRLTQHQRRFVIETPASQSIRLRGAPGTGKTIALILKLLQTAYISIKNKRPVRLAYITPNKAVAEQAENIIRSLDEQGILDGLCEDVTIDVTTLHALAARHLRLDLDGITPLSLDADEGMRLQFELVDSVLNSYQKSGWLAKRMRCSELFQKQMGYNLSSIERRAFVYEIMNEFGAILDAYGAGSFDEKASKYLKEKRPSWSMQLNKDGDRQVVIDLYRIYKKELSDMGTISNDQLVADFLGHLDQFRWSNLRKRDGYDVIFVDELHFFNKQDRSAFHLLTRKQEEPPVVIMAYDPKQSTRDLFLPSLDGEEGNSALWRETKLGRIERMDLTDVFRYTPEILRLVSYIDALYPASLLGSDWAPHASFSRLEPGPLPTISEHADDLSLYNQIFNKAERLAHQQRRGSDVAILSLSHDLFHSYLRAGAKKDSYLPITSRDEIVSIQHAGKRFVFSMPEYVAGLQFKTVFVIGCNRQDAAAVGTHPDARRRFASLAYLAISRAEKVVELHYSLERGGPAELFHNAIEQEILRLI